MKDKLIKWMKDISPFYRDPGKIEPKKTALLIIDMENYFVSPSGNSFLPSSVYILPNIKKLLTFFRREKLSVIYTAHQHLDPIIDGGMLARWWGDSIMENTDQAEICEELAPIDRERIIKKRRYSAFYQTDLELILRGLKIKNLLITGVMTNLCCETTARDAFQRDFRVFFIADGNCSANDDMHLNSLKNLAFGFAHVITADDMIGLLK